MARATPSRPPLASALANVWTAAGYPPNSPSWHFPFPPSARSRDRCFPAGTSRPLCNGVSTSAFLRFTGSKKSGCVRISKSHCLIMKKDGAILVVEDDLNDQYFIEISFRSSGVGCPVHIVGNGEEAMSYLRGDGPYSDRDKYPYPKLIMTDLKTPGVNGFQLLAILKSDPVWAVIPTIVLSASYHQEDIKRSYLMGASSYHVKPMHIKDLRSQLGLIHAYWMTAAVPEVDRNRRSTATKPC
jgi:CheY-like chemotaxis protein